LPEREPRTPTDVGDPGRSLRPTERDPATAPSPSNEPDTAPPLRFGRRITLEEAERELERLHRRAMSALLRRAAAQVVTRAPWYGVLTSYPLPPQAERAWRRDARSAIRAAAQDGWAPVGLSLVARLLRTPSDRWPRASRLAQAARRVEDGEFSRVCQGFALLCEGEHAEADRLFAGLLRRSDVLRHRRRVLEGLGLAHLAAGRARLALGALESAAEDPRAGTGTLVDALLLTLVVGDVGRARRAAARLDMLVDPQAPAFAAVLGRLGRRLDEPELQVRPTERSALDYVRELAREERSPAGRVCRALI
jgi:hypothetical protein